MTYFCHTKDSALGIDSNLDDRGAALVNLLLITATEVSQPMASYAGRSLRVLDVANTQTMMDGLIFSGEARTAAKDMNSPVFVRFQGQGGADTPDYVWLVEKNAAPVLVHGDADSLDPIVIVATGQSNVISSARSIGGQSTDNDMVFAWNTDNIGMPSPGTGWAKSELGSFPYQTASQDPDDPANPDPGPANNFVHNFAGHLQEESGKPVFVILAAGGSSESHAWTPTLDYTTRAASEAALANGTAQRGETRLDEATGKIAVLQYGENDTDGSGALQWDERGKGYWQYERLVTEITTALASGPLGPEGADEDLIDLFLVEQGEGDFNDLDGTTSDAEEGRMFTDNWTAFISDFRNQSFAPSDLPFIFGKLAEDGKWSERNPEIIALANSMNRVVYSESAGLELQADTVHPTGPGVYEKGYHRYWDAYLELFRPGAPDLRPAWDTGPQADDNLTNERTLSFRGEAEAGALVKLFSSLDGFIGSGTANQNGDWWITTNGDLSHGAHLVRARADLPNGVVTGTSQALAVRVNSAPEIAAAVTRTYSEDAGRGTVYLLQHASDPDADDALRTENLTHLSGNTAGITYVGNRLEIDLSAYNDLTDGQKVIVRYAYDVIDMNGLSVAQTARIEINGANDFSNGNDVIGGTDGRDVLNGYGGDDQLYGRDGNDSLTGGDGADEMHGQAGNDTLFGGPGADMLFGGLDTDTANYRNSSAGVIIDLDAGTASGGEASGDTLVSIERLTGSAHDDALVGNALNNWLTGLAGNDVLSGGDGHDTLIGGAGADSISGGAGTDTVNYRDSATGVIVNLFNGTGIGGEAEGDILSGIERLYGSAYTDRLYGDGAANYLIGRSGDDLLSGGGNNDILRADAGHDTLNGGAGFDVLRGGAGSDRFIFRAGNNTDVIRDFDAAEDMLDLTSFGFASLPAALVFASEATGHTIFNFGFGDMARLENTNLGELDSANILI